MLKYLRNLPKKNRVIIALVIAIISTYILTQTLFFPKTPRVNQYFISSIPEQLTSLALKIKLMTKTNPTSTPVLLPTDVQIPTQQMMPSQPQKPTSIPVVTTLKPTQPIIPTIAPTAIPTKNPPTIIPSPTVRVQPTISQTGCPTSSSESYSSMKAYRSNDDLIFGDPATSPEINVRLRGFGPVNESTGFIGRGGSTYGLDDKQPPQISSLYGGVRPKIIKTYIVYEWDFENNKSAAPRPATPNYKVTMIGFDSTPGQKLVGLKAGREIGGGNVFMVLYATKNDVVFTHSTSDTLMGGYLFMYLDLCVDPNLLAKYEQNNVSGRGELPVIAPGQVFGYGSNTDVKLVVRDTMSFMDTRYNEDWWDYP